MVTLEVTPDITEVTPKLYYNEDGKLIAPPPDAPAVCHK